MINNFDNEIKKALFNKSENIKTSHNLLNSIKNQVYEKENTMKKYKFTPRTILVASVLTIILATGVIASGGLAYIQSSSDNRNAINHYPTIEEVKKEVDYVPKYPKTLGGYEFDTAQPSKSKDIDEAHNVLNSYNDIGFYYKTDKGILTLDTTKAVRENDKSGESINYKGLTLYYNSIIYKAVPPDYIETSEDKERISKGELTIGYGSDKISEEKTQNILWVENGITYNLLDMGVEIDKNDFVNMAKEVIDQK